MFGRMRSWSRQVYFSYPSLPLPSPVSVTSSPLLSPSPFYPLSPLLPHFPSLPLVEKRLRTSKGSPSAVTFPKPPTAGRKTPSVGVQRLGAARQPQCSKEHAFEETSENECLSPLCVRGVYHLEHHSHSQ